MPRENLNDILVFIAVAREKSLPRAAAKLGVSQSALSHTIRDLEARLGLRLLTRTTRSVSTTEAGEELFQAVAPRIEEIDASIAGFIGFQGQARWDHSHHRNGSSGGDGHLADFG